MDGKVHFFRPTRLEPSMVKDPERKQHSNDNTNSNSALRYLFLSLTDTAGFQEAVRESGKNCPPDHQGNDN